MLSSSRSALCFAHIRKFCVVGKRFLCRETLSSYLKSNQCDMNSESPWSFLMNSLSERHSEGKKLNYGIHNRDSKCNNIFRSSTASIKAYAQSGDLKNARNVFDKMQARDVVTWTVMLTAYVKYGQGMQALELFSKMHENGILPDQFSYTCAIDACTMLTCLEYGNMIHGSMIGQCANSSIVTETALITLYSKCGTMADARNLFSAVHQKDVVCWNAMISGLLENEYEKEVMKLFRQMQLEGVKPNIITYVYILTACSRLASLADGVVVHMALLEAGYGHQLRVNTALVSMYAKCGKICKSLHIFDQSLSKDTILWTAIISSLAQSENFGKAVKFFYQMYCTHVTPDHITFACVADAIASLKAAEEGFELHAAIIDSKHQRNVVVVNSLVNMYIKLGYINDAMSVFETLFLPDVLVWNTMLQVLENNMQTLLLFAKVCQQGVAPNEDTYVCVINSVAKLKVFEEGQILHFTIVHFGYDDCLVILAALIDMYGKNLKVEEARSIFERAHAMDVVCWNSMISAFIQSGKYQEGLDMFYKMEQSHVNPSNVSFACVIEACTALNSLSNGQELHSKLITVGCSCDVMIDTGLIQMYGKCGLLCDARMIYKNMSHHDVVSCTSMLRMCIENGLFQEGMDLLADCLSNDTKLDIVTFICILDACANLAIMELGFIVHTAIVEAAIEQDVLIVTGLINIYSKYGCAREAKQLFSSVSNYDTGVWNAMLGALAHYGDCETAKRLFNKLKLSGIEPNHTTFISMLAACSHSGMIEDGWYIISCMNNEDGLLPMVDHYVCLVDLLGRAGQLSAGQAVIDYKPFQMTAIAWRCLFGACIIHGAKQYGESIAMFCFESDVDSDAPYVMLSNMYAAV